jgi:hypothetical protein
MKKVGLCTLNLSLGRKEEEPKRLLLCLLIMNRCKLRILWCPVLIRNVNLLYKLQTNFEHASI